MEINNLKAFFYVAKYHSYTQAAKKLFVTPSAINKRITKLEDEFGAKLFDQFGHAAVLTQTGQVLLPHAEMILMASGNAKQTLQDLYQSEVAGSLHLGTTYSTSDALLPVLRNFLQDYPDVHFDITCLPPPFVLKNIEEGEVDFYITPLPEATLPESVITDLLWQDEYAVVAGWKHPLSQRSSCTLKDLNDHTVIIPGRGYHLEHATTQLFKNAGLALTEQRIEVNYYTLCFELVGLNLGWSFLPKRIMNDSVKIMNVTDLTESMMPIYMLCHAQKTLSQVAKAFIERVRLEAPNNKASS